MEEVNKAIEEMSVSEAAELKRIMIELKESRAFQFLCLELKTQAMQRNHTMLLPPTGIDSPIKNTYTSGEVAGLYVAVGFVDLLISRAQTQIDVDKIREK